MQKSTPNKYGSVAVTIHWLTVLLIVGLLISGNRLDGMTDSAAKAQLLMIHAPVGVLIGLLTVLRIFWWWRFDKKPEPAGTTPAWQERAAQGVHVLFYVVILGMAASGVGMMVLSGAGEIVFGGAPGSLPDFGGYAPRMPHGIGAKVMFALLIVHAGAALYHHFFLKDKLLRRMWYR